MRPKVNPSGNPREASVPPVVAENISVRPSVPEAPDHLAELGAALWVDLWEAGGDAYHPPTDRFIIERYCTLHDRRETLMGYVERDGFVVPGSTGQDTLHPAAKELAATEKELRALEDRLGLNPEARARLNIATIEHKSKLDAFLEGENLD